ncbi:Arc family DNA-binding protein [Pseudoalteromonas tetraodonis]|uniref:Arc family DNA-binding protein n=1 Tax=Pseudoalteromonas tetraodonis TaxID=43659 RepID=UPI003A9784A2
MSQPRSYSLRMPEEVRCYIEDVAKQNARSVNAEIITRLEDSIHKDTTNNIPVNVDLLEQLQIALEQRQALGAQVHTMQERLGGLSILLSNLNHHVIPALCQTKNTRLASAGTTYGDKDRLCAFINGFFSASEIVFYIRDGHSNHSALTVLLKGDANNFLADATPMTVERLPREREVLELFQDLDERGLLDVAEFAVTRVKQTRDLPVDQAIEELEQYETKPVRSNVYEFLSLFFREPEKVKPDWFVDEWKKLN